MSGVALGGFMSGMLGGASMASSAMKTMQPSQQAAAPSSDTPGFGLGQPLVKGDIGSSTMAEPTGGTGWGSLKKIVSSMGEPSQSKSLMAFKPSGGF